MRPKPACRMYLIAWWHMFQCPLRCTATTESKSSSDMFQIMRSRRLPAQLTRMSILPNSSTHCFTIRPALR